MKKQKDTPRTSADVTGSCYGASSEAGTHSHAPENVSALRPVMVTTAHRGVFFGYTDDTSGATITLRNARLCVYWSADLRGFMGLASAGPNLNCKIGPRVESIELRDITSVCAVSPEAVEKWEAAPWNG